MKSNYRRLAALVGSVAMTVGVATVGAPPAAAAPSPVSVDVVGIEHTVDAGTGLATATYAITATNAGPSSLTHGVLTADGSPGGTTATNVFTSAQGNVPISCEGGTTLRCKFLTEWKPGELTVRVSFTLPVDDVESITYSAEVSGYSQTRSASSKSSFVDEAAASKPTEVNGQYECGPDKTGNREACPAEASDDGMTVLVTAPACTASDTSCPSVRIWVDIVEGDNSACDSDPNTIGATPACIYGSALVYVDELGAGEDDRFCDDEDDPATCLKIVMSWPLLDSIELDLVTVHHDGQVVPKAEPGLPVLGCSPSEDDLATEEVDEDACHATTSVDVDHPVGNVAVEVYSYDNGGWGGS